MQQYRNYAPSRSDIKGLNLPDRQDWWVVVGRNRDSSIAEESNFDAALKILGGESETCEVHRFGHWACGWIEIILLPPEREREGIAIEARLNEYPYLDEDDVYERENEAAWEWFVEQQQIEVKRDLKRVFCLSDRAYDLLDVVPVGDLYSWLVDHCRVGLIDTFDGVYHWPDFESPPRPDRDDMACLLRRARGPK